MLDITIDGISKSFGTGRVIDNVSFTVKSGEFVSIVGESGSGKSTLLGIIAGNVKADKGHIYFGDADIATFNDKMMAKFRRTVLGFVYQFFNLVPTMKVRDNILLPIRLDRGKFCDIEKWFTELTELLGITHIMDRYPEKLSGGEQQRVAIARALIYHPEVIMLDEPTGNLDSRGSTNIMELLAKLNKTYHVTVIQVTHSAECTKYGDKTITLKDGAIVETRVN